MLRALSAGVSGLIGQENRLDAIGNNIANANTIGYRASRVNFKELFSQTLSAGSAGTNTLGSQNPAQIGLGMQVGSVDIATHSGSLERTGQETDMAVQGDGFFIVKDTNGTPLFTRAGHFGWDAQGYLVNPSTGQRVQGWLAAPGGGFGPQNLGTLADVRIAVGQTAAQATTQVTFGSNLDAGAAVGTQYKTSATVYDSLGRAWNVQFTFQKTASNTWDWAATDPVSGVGYLGSGPANDGASPLGPATGQLTFNNSGNLSTATPDGSLTFSPAGAAPVSLTLHFGSVTQLAAAGGSTLAYTSQDGLAAGVATGVKIDSNGVIRQIFSNGSSKPVAQMALATFANPSGLLRAGDTNFGVSSASGIARVGPPGGGQGTLVTGVLEQSNVDLSQEFTDLIVTQRAFQANTRVITASDEVLQDLVNLRR